MATGYTGTVAFSSSDARPSCRPIILHRLQGRDAHVLRHVRDDGHTVDHRDRHDDVEHHGSAEHIGDRPARRPRSSSTDTTTRGTGSGPTARRATTSSAARPACPAMPPSRPRALPTYTLTTDATTARCPREPRRQRRHRRLLVLRHQLHRGSWTSTGGQLQDLALYFLDYDRHRAGASRCSSATPRRGRCWTPRRSPSFSSGVYLQWAVSGNIVITFTTLAGRQRRPQRPVPRPVSTAVRVHGRVVKTDTTTEGNWIGTYGTQGYDIIGGAANLPSYATVTPSGPVDLYLDHRHDRPRVPSRTPAAPAHRRLLVLGHQLHGGCGPDRRPVARPGPVLPRLGQNKAGVEQVQLSNATTGAVLDTRRSRRSPRASTCSGRSAGTS